MEISNENLIEILVNSSNKEKLKNINIQEPMKNQDVDSLDLISYFFEIEKVFSIKITTDQQQKIETIDDLRKFLIKTQ